MPGVSVTLVGDTLTPPGTPEIWMVTCDPNPFTGLADKLTDTELPAFSVSLVGFTPKLKSGVGGGR